MATPQQIKPASELARMNGVRFPNESDEFGVPGTRCGPRKSSSGVTSNGWHSSAARPT